jgi:pimeloyl-ACP methyl ester carboxylesterase
MTPLVMLPGMMCDARLFAPQLAAFSGQRNVMVGAMVGQADMAALARQVLQDAPPQFALMGLSMGGILAMEICRQAPDRVAGLALLDTNPLAETDAVAQRREPQITKVQSGGLAAVMRDEMKPNYLANGPRRSDVLDLCMDMARSLGPQVFVDQSRALQTRPDQSETLRRYARPALVLCGREDTLCPVHRHTLMADLLPNATLTIIDGAGHLPTLERPNATNQALARWLEDI